MCSILGKECVAAIHSAMEEIDTQSKDQKQWGVLNKRFQWVYIFNNIHTHVCMSSVYTPPGTTTLRH